MKHIWFFDRGYFLPSIAHLKTFCEEIKTHELMEGLWNIGDVWDCDDFSILASALIRLKVKEVSDVPYPFGRAMGNEFRGMPILHSLNICMCQEGVYFIDYDDGGRIWQADSENDSIFFVSV